MVPLTSTPTPTTAANLAPTWNPAGQSFAGDEFSNNLFSDLAPLLALFGEQVTKQFLSMSMGWADNILVAMGPLGILTTVVSAIRVGGVKNLKSLVGRARESLAIAEQELLSSTSDNVCEMWSGTDIVRQLGKPKTMELILVRNEDTGMPEVIGLAEAIHNGYMRCGGKRGYYLSEPKKLASQAPNIALNSEGSLTSKRELWLWAIVGIILQLTAIVFPALTAYLWKFSKAGSNIQGYAYPCFASGTLAVVFGVALCSHVIEEVTSEEMFESEPGKVLNITRLQRACTVSDQSFQPFLIMNPPKNKKIRTSRLLSQPGRRRRLSNLTGFATILTILGFIFQFVGLRGLHWSATIFQLSITLVMTGARSWCELEMTALILATYPSGVPDHRFDYSCKFKFMNWTWSNLGGLPQFREQEPPNRETESNLPSILESASSIRKDLAQLMPDTPVRDEIFEATSNLVLSMTKILDCYEEAIQNRWIQVKNRTLGQKLFEWSHHAAYLKDGMWKYETVSCSWEKAPLEINKENQSQFELILRLCMCSYDPHDYVMMLPPVVVGHGDLCKRDELEGWLGINKIRGPAPGKGGFDDRRYGPAAVPGTSALSFRPTFRPGSEYFFIHFFSRSLPQLLALELFSGFMNSLAESVNAIGGLTNSFTDRSYQGRSVSIKENSVLLSFAQVLVDCSLTETMDDANIYVIPPFVNRGLVPTECGDVTFDERFIDHSSHSSVQGLPTTSTGSAQSDPTDQSKQANVSGPSKETVEDEERSEPQVESVMKGEDITNKNKLVNEDQEKLLKDGPVADSSHSDCSASESEDAGKGETRQE